MAIDPKLVSIIPASELPTDTPTSAGQFFFFEGNQMKKAPMTEIYELVSGSQSLGTITPTSTIPTEGNVWGFAAPGTYPNAGNLTISPNTMGILSRVGTTWSKVGVTAYQNITQNINNNTYNLDPEQIVPSEALYNDDTLAGDILKRVDKTTGENVNYREITTWYDGSTMTDEKVDGVLYKKINGVFYRMQFNREGENFISFSNMEDFRNISDFNLLLLKAKIFKGVELTGYYDDFQYENPVYYYLTNETYIDNGGSEIVIDSLFFKCELDKINPLFFGIKNGVSEDFSDNWIKMLSFASNKNKRIDGCGLVYYILKEIISTAVNIDLFNCKFLLNNNYQIHSGFKFTKWKNFNLDKIHVDGGKGTYKIGEEEWIEFDGDNSIPSIMPSFYYFFHLDKNNEQNQFVNLGTIEFVNCHLHSCINIFTGGDVFVNNLIVENCSYKSLHVYHEDINNNHTGKTNVVNYKAKNLGLMASSFTETIDGVKSVGKNINTSTGLPQWSYGLIVSYGEFTILNADVENFGACGITSDRNKKFHGGNIKITNNSNLFASNNPSGAMWFEETEDAYIDNLYIDVSDRNSRDLLNDSSLLEVFNGNTIVNNVKLISSKNNIFKKAIRGAFSAKSFFKIMGQCEIIGGFSAKGIELASMIQNTDFNCEIEKTKCVDSEILFYGVKNVKLNNCEFSKIQIENLNNDISIGDIVISKTILNECFVNTKAYKLFVIDSIVKDNFEVNNNTNKTSIKGCSMGRYYTLPNKINKETILTDSSFRDVRIAGETVNVSNVISTKGFEIGNAIELNVVGNILKTNIPNYSLLIMANDVVTGIIANNNFIAVGGAGFLRIPDETISAKIIQVNNKESS